MDTLEVLAPLSSVTGTISVPTDEARRQQRIQIRRSSQCILYWICIVEILKP